ncbi:hypothetical protein K1X13_03000 [Nocardioides sp. WL0053]|uniref:Histidine kinase/HSP90-like ATPase domain-containing protein n=1 Tax=Nocardioides jiangsuensis TaxID=2866161 RepID=A0ABS7RH02_9ACTN|nr:histidine kinase [Nocardioides jiangsuensis]MBY9073782.1 hypothetical protein [Nocardioides jiangsuensis]
MNQLDRVTLASRVFCIAAVLGLTLLSRDGEVLFSLVVVATVAMTAVYVSLVTELRGIWVVAFEALVTGLVIGSAPPGGVVLLPYLVVLSLIAGITRGLVGLATVMTAELATVLALPMLFAEVEGLQARSEVFAPWLLTSLGAGLLGAWLREIGKAPLPVSDPSYESARRLLTQLRTVARRLSAGLDPVSLASQMLATVHETTGTSGSAVFVRVDGGLLTPLSYRGEGANERLHPELAVVGRCWTEMVPCDAAVAGPESAPRRLAAFPLRVGSRMIGVLLADVPELLDRASTADLMRELDAQSIRLDTALAFEEVRSLATVEERRRLAREIHDGIAQEVASLGYLVDDLTATAESEDQRARLSALRGELTRVVSELRLSIFDLRSDVVASTGLGAALSDYLHSVGARSDLTVHLTLDEAPTRLRAETETELLRIAQEAVTNARKHTDARNIWVNCRVQPPFASLEIRDDGGGLGTARPDSYGLRIMRERAERVDARLAISEHHDLPGPGGTVVTVTLGTEHALPEPRVKADR